MARLFAAFALLQLLALTAQVGGGAHVLIVGVEGAGHHTICNGMLSKDVKDCGVFINEPPIRA